jgi:antitoxin (DNA-binding transcriptional repressor) of toxin-antitoxin stability system
MKTITTSEARLHISGLAHRVQMGNEFVVTKEGVAVFKVTRPDDSSERTLGVDDGMFEIPDSFNDPIDWAAPQDSNR